MHIKEFCTEHEVDTIIWIDDDHSSQASISIDILISVLASQFLLVSDPIKDSAKGIFFQNIDKTYHTRLGRIFDDLKSNEDTASFEEQINPILSDADDSRELVTQALDVLGGSITSPEAMKAINDYLVLGGKIKKYSFACWNSNCEAIINTFEDSKILLLLDLQNTKEIGVEFGQEGLKILNYISSKKIEDEVIVIVLTSTVESHRELKYGRELSNEYLATATLPISVLSKSKGFSEKAIVAFEEIFHRIALVGSYSKLKEKMSIKYKESIDSVFSELKPITIEELVWCVARNAAKDGVSEFDALMRVIDHEAKRSFKASILDDSELKKLIFRCRKFDTEIQKREDIDTEAIAKFHLSEVFEDIDLLNSLHAQISIGDIFKIKNHSDQQLFLLVGNMCNTALRGETGKRKDKSALLFPLKSKCESLNLIEVGPCSQFQDDFDCGGNMAIDITEPFTLPYKELDLCWLDNNGVSTAFSHSDINDLLHSGVLSRAQNKRAEIMMDRTVVQEEAEYVICRVGRISESKTFEVMQEYSRRLSILPRDILYN